MSNAQFQSLRRLLLGLTVALFFVGGSVLVSTSIPAAHATSSDSKWTCAVTDRLNDVEDAEDWKGSRQAARALNKMASHVPTGTVTVFRYEGSGADLLCVK
jgi:hypothetical protein